MAVTNFTIDYIYDHAGILPWPCDPKVTPFVRLGLVRLLKCKHVMWSTRVIHTHIPSARVVFVWNCGMSIILPLFYLPKKFRHFQKHCDWDVKFESKCDKAKNSFPCRKSEAGHFEGFNVEFWLCVYNCSLTWDKCTLARILKVSADYSGWPAICCFFW